MYDGEQESWSSEKTVLLEVNDGCPAQRTGTHDHRDQEHGALKDLMEAPLNFPEEALRTGQAGAIKGAGAL